MKREELAQKLFLHIPEKLWTYLLISVKIKDNSEQIYKSNLQVWDCLDHNKYILTYTFNNNIHKYSL